MKIAVIGTGTVGRSIATRLAGLGHDVVIGTRDVSATLARPGTDGSESDSFAAWQREHPTIELLSLPEAGARGDVVLNAVNGQHALTALNEIGADVLAEKVLLDLALPLDLSEGFPPTLTISNTDSLGETIQRAFPKTKVVKSLTSVYYEVMIDPGRVPGPHSIFVAGDDSAAKLVIGDILHGFGWPEESIIDLGDITGARGVEMYARLFFTLHNAFGTFDFNINVTRAV